LIEPEFHQTIEPGFVGAFNVCFELFVDEELCLEFIEADPDATTKKFEVVEGVGFGMAGATGATGATWAVGTAGAAGALGDHKTYLLFCDREERVEWAIICILELRILDFGDISRRELFGSKGDTLLRLRSHCLGPNQEGIGSVKSFLVSADTVGYKA